MRAYGFVDWSGDTGFKFSSGSSTFFIVTVISSGNYANLREQLKKLKEQLGLPMSYEFHFVHNSKTVRTAFFTVLARCEWEGAGLTVDKRKLSKEFKKMKTSDFCSFFLGHLLARAPLDWIKVKHLLVDDSSKNSPVIKGMKLATSPVLLARGIKKTPKVRGEASHLSDGIQIADMLAGALKERERGGVDYLRGLKKHLKIYRYETVK